MPRPNEENQFSQCLFDLMRLDEEAWKPPVWQIALSIAIAWFVPLLALLGIVGVGRWIAAGFRKERQ